MITKPGNGNGGKQQNDIFLFSSEFGKQVNVSHTQKQVSKLNEERVAVQTQSGASTERSEPTLITDE